MNRLLACNWTRRLWWPLHGIALIVFVPSGSAAQNPERPALQAGVLTAEFVLDGVLDESTWASADLIAGLTMIEPVEGGMLTGKTEVRVLANSRTIVIGIVCEDPDPSGIVSFSKARDSELQSEDHIKLIFDTSLDGRSGYIFAVNPSGARYDALVANQGEGENRQWDTAWEAATFRGSRG